MNGVFLAIGALLPICLAGGALLGYAAVRFRVLALDLQLAWVAQLAAFVEAEALGAAPRVEADGALHHQAVRVGQGLVEVHPGLRGAGQQGEAGENQGDCLHGNLIPGSRKVA